MHTHTSLCNFIHLALFSSWDWNTGCKPATPPGDRYSTLRFMRQGQLFWVWDRKSIFCSLRLSVIDEHFHETDPPKPGGSLQILAAVELHAG